MRGKNNFDYVSKISPQNCVFYENFLLKQPIRTEYLIKQKPQDALVGKQERMKRGRQPAFWFSVQCLYNWGIETAANHSWQDFLMEIKIECYFSLRVILNETFDINNIG